MSKVKVQNLISAYEFTLFLQQLEEKGIELVIESNSNLKSDVKLICHRLPSQKIVQIRDNFEFKTFKYDDILSLELTYNKDKIKVTDINYNFIWILTLKTKTKASKQIKIEYDSNNSIINIIRRTYSKFASALS